MEENYQIETKCIQSGWKPTKGEPRVLPIYQSTTFKYDTSDQMGRLFDLEEAGYFYTRLQNPTNDAVAAKICDLEGGVAAMLTSSGQAANFYAIMNIVQAGDHIVCASALYGGTYNLYAHTIRKMGVEATFVDPDCTKEELEAAFQENTKAVFGETIANPALVVLDLGVLSLVALFMGYAFEAIMFPTIFALSLRGLGNYTKRASSYLMMSPIGGAVGPLMMGYVADQTNMSFSFIVPLLSFVVVLLYAWKVKQRSLC